MHIDYAKESVAFTTKNGASDVVAIRTIAVDEIVDLAEKVGSEKIQSIAATMKQSKGYRYVSGHKKITIKQQQAVAEFLVEMFGSAEKVIEAAFNKSE